MIPTKAQWRAWSLPSKLGCIGTYLGAASLLLSIVFYVWPMPLGEPHKSSGIVLKSTIEKQIGFYSKMAQARQWQPPELLATQTTIKVRFGEVPIIFPVWRLKVPVPIEIPFQYKGEEPTFSPYILNNRVYVKTFTVFGDAAKTVAMNDEWDLKIPPIWDRNFNQNSFEIVDDNMLPVFQIKYISAADIELDGVFVNTNGTIITAFGHVFKSAQAGYPVPIIQERKAWFKYPSTNHLGELDD